MICGNRFVVFAIVHALREHLLIINRMMGDINIVLRQTYNRSIIYHIDYVKNGVFVSVLQEQAVQMISDLSDDNVSFLIEIIRRLMPKKTVMRASFPG